MEQKSGFTFLFTEFVRYKTTPRPEGPPLFPNHQRAIWLLFAIIGSPLLAILSYFALQSVVMAIETGVYTSAKYSVERTSSPIYFWGSIIVGLVLTFLCFVGAIGGVVGFIKRIRK